MPELVQLLLMPLLPDRRKRVFCSVAILLCTCFWVVRLFSKPPTLKQHATRSMECLEAGDANCILDQMSPGEIEKCGYTRENLQAVLNEIVTPTLRQVKKVGTLEDQSFTGQSVVYRSYKLPNGQSFVFSSDAISDGESPRLIFSNILLSVLRLKVCLEHPNEKTNEALWIGQTDELERLTPRLNMLGIKGMYLHLPVEGEEEFIPLQTYIINSREFMRLGGRAKDLESL